MQRNPNLGILHSNYLFAEIARKAKTLKESQKDARLINLGIGDTSIPISGAVVNAWKNTADQLGTEKGYTGYESYEGRAELCNAIISRFYKGLIVQDEVFVSDGAKTALGRLPLMYNHQARIGVQDPAYPVYIDTNVILGHAFHYDSNQGKYEGITYLPCTASNGFFPDFALAPPLDVLYICAPNNPMGTMPSREQLKDLVAYAKKNSTLIIYDSAYAGFITDAKLPKTIYEIPGAREVSIEVGSLSKLAGFSGVRLGWVVVPKELRWNDKSSVHQDWSRINSIFYNGTSNLSQAGGLAVLKDEEGWQACQNNINTYMENSKILKQAIFTRGWNCFGGDHAPYLWVEAGKDSWKVFNEFLETLHIVTTPGIGFGPSGQGYIRLSALGKRHDVLEAAQRITQGKVD